MNRLATATLLLALTVFALPAVGQQQNIRRTPGGITVNFQDVDLAYVISSLAQAAGLNVMYYDLPAKQVTMRTVQPVSLENVAGLIRDLAEANGVSIVEGNGFMRLQGGSAPGAAQQPRQLYIQRLQHARAPVLANTLMALFGGATVATSAGQAMTTLSRQLQDIEQRNAQLRALGQASPAQQQLIIPQLRAGGELEAPVSIVPDELTNALLIRATAADWQIIQQAIQALDLRPLQVVIEVLIVEVSRTDDLNVGVSVLAEDVSGDNATVASLPGTQDPNDFSLSIFRAGDVNIEATLSALASTGNVQILSRPLVHAQNNQEAFILVGSERPFVQVSQASTLTEVRNDVVSYRNVGTSLTITPTINEEGYVNMLVTQQVSSATNEVQFGAPVISTREAETQLLARNGQTVVVGGLVDRQSDRARSGIPFLKDIPILGFLFGTTRETTLNSELFLFLTPYIVATDEDADRVRQEIEARSELLEGIIPIPPITPPVIRVIPDTIRAVQDTSRGPGGG